jgi:hypothetical protein
MPEGMSREREFPSLKSLHPKDSLNVSQECRCEKRQNTVDSHRFAGISKIKNNMRGWIKDGHQDEKAKVKRVKTSEENE